MRVAFIGLAVILATTTSALAQSDTCTAEPEPAVMALSDFEELELEKAKEASTNLYKDIKLYQERNTAYRACLTPQIDAIKAKGDEATAADRSAMKKLVEAHDKSIESEETVGKNFNAMLDSLCARGDKGSCPPS
jgi:hypothetical protein